MALDAEGFVHPALADVARYFTVGIPPLDAPAAQLAQTLGLETTVIKFAVTLYLAVVIAPLNRAMPATWMRHAFTLVVGVALCQYVFASRWMHVFNIATVCYVALFVLHAVPLTRRVAHLVVAAVAFLHLSMRHILRSGVTANNVDDSVVQMVLTIKLFTLAFNFFDGAVDAAKLKREAEDNTQSPTFRRIRQDRIARGISALPNPLVFYAYVFNFTTMFVGPAFEITEYERSQARQLTGALAASRWWPFAQRLVEGTLCLAANVVLQPYFPIRGIYDNAMAGMPLAEQALRAHAALFLLRVQYYAVWKLAEAASVGAGFGLAPRTDDAPAEWSGASNVNAVAVETGGSYSYILRNWNMFTQSWLERYVFLRVTRAYSINRWATFLFSAFWHGFYAGYYMAFIAVPIYEQAAGMVYRVFRPRLTRDGVYDTSRPEYMLYSALKVLLIQLSLDYALTSFTLLHWQLGFATWRSWGFVGQVLPLAMMATAAVTQALFGAPKEDIKKGAKATSAPKATPAAAVHANGSNGVAASNGSASHKPKAA